MEELIVNTIKFNHELMEQNIKYSEEIERLKKGYCELKEKCNKGDCDCTHEEYNSMGETNIKLMNRIDKAIEYIKEKARNNCWIDIYEANELINILKGSDKE